MKITGVETILIRAADSSQVTGEGEFLVTPMHVFPDYASVLGEGFVGLRGGPVGAVLVRVLTNDGLEGIGSVGVGNGAGAYIIEHCLKPIILGASPFDVEVLWEKMFRSSINYGRKGVAVEAISAIDIALWDLMGKAVGQPVYNLLGGKTRECIRVYASRLYARDDLELLAREAAAFRAKGFTALKQRLGFGPADGPEGMRKNLELIRTVREAVGPDVDLMADAYMGWDVPYAIRMIRMLEDAGMDLRWVEEPVIPDDID